MTKFTLVLAMAAAAPLRPAPTNHFFLGAAPSGNDGPAILNVLFCRDLINETPSEQLSDTMFACKR
jgi:hypothetical protein